LTRKVKTWFQAFAFKFNVYRYVKVAVRACGADAVANAVYAVAHARKYLKDNGVDVYFCPEFEMEPVGSDGQERTVVLFKVCKAAGSAPVAETVEAA
jgi:stage V sporulation protein SpoVS